MAKTVFIPDKKRLEDLNNMAYRTHGRSIIPKMLATIEEGKYPVTASYLVDDFTIRAEIVVNQQGDTAHVDMSLTDFNKLPVFDSEAASPATQK